LFGGRRHFMRREVVEHHDVAGRSHGTLGPAIDPWSVSGASTKHLYRSDSSSTGDHILFLTSGTTPNLRHQPSSGGPVTITSSVAIVNDTTWSTIVGTWRPGRLELYVDGFSRASSTATATNTSALFGIYRWGWGLPR
jgi:hypothetical protein